MHSTYYAPLHSGQAQAYTLRALLNCYCRDVAGPQGHIDYPLPQSNWPQAFFDHWQHSGGVPLTLALPSMESGLLLLVDKHSCTSSFRFLSHCWLLDNGTYQPVDAECTSRALLQELAARYQQPLNEELLAQISNSAQVLALLLENVAAQAEQPVVEDALMRSERQLLLGHAFHPAPKSRLGFSQQQLLTYSPELKTEFALDYMAVHPDLAVVRNPARISIQAELLRLAELDEQDLSPGWQLIPLHPWQAEYLRQQPRVQQMQAQGLLEDLGNRGKAFQPTSSIRTLYRADCPFFIKGSLNVRITNCVRKNAPYELESAVALTALLEPEFTRLEADYPGLVILREPAALSLDWPECNEAERKMLQEGFGVILRENRQPEAADETLQLAGGLFAQGLDGMNNVHDLVWQFSRHQQLGIFSARIRWFEHYVAALLPPMMQALCEQGIAFEPHLQNTLLRIDATGAVRGAVIRDLEGTKLIDELWPQNRLGNLTDRARQSVHYDREKGWKRIGYCLFINNFCQAIFCLSGSDPVLEHRLWQVVRHQVSTLLASTGNPELQLRLGQLLSGAPLPNKSNLLTRVQKSADRGAEYTEFPNPLLSPGVQHTDIPQAQPAGAVA